MDASLTHGLERAERPLVLLAAPGRPHLPALDALRGAAVLLVTLYHLRGTHPGPAASGAMLLPGLDIGARGVDLFFVLSGFLITGILYDTKGNRDYLLDFFARRTLRIFPLYYGVLFVSLAVIPALTGRITWQGAADDHSTWLWIYGSNLLIAWRGEWCFGPFDHFWSLAMEEQFYLVWPLLIGWLSRRRALLVCGLLVAFAILTRLAWVLAGGNEVTRYVLPLFRVDCLAAGAWIALYLRGGSALEALARPARVVLSASLLILVPASLLGLRLLSLIDVAWTLAFAALLVVMLSAAPRSPLGLAGRSLVLRWLGKYSYGIYVYGNLLIAACAPYVTAPGLADALGSAYAGQLVYAVLLGTTTVVMAVMSWHLYEKHFLKLKHWFNSEPSNSH